MTYMLLNYKFFSDGPVELSKLLTEQVYRKSKIEEAHKIYEA